MAASQWVKRPSNGAPAMVPANPSQLLAGSMRQSVAQAGVVSMSHTTIAGRSAKVHLLRSEPVAEASREHADEHIVAQQDVVTPSGRDMSDEQGYEDPSAGFVDSFQHWLRRLLVG